MLTSLASRLSTVSKDSWHYRLVNYGLGDPTELIKRACPYWLVLVPLSMITGTIRFTVTSIYYLVLHVGYYPWMAFVWTLGYKPRYWRGLYKFYQADDSLLIYEEVYYRHRWNKHSICHWYVPVLMAPVLTFTPLIIWVWDFGHKQADVVTALPVYYIALIAYAGLLVLIALGNAWKLGAWPVVKRAYCAVCPELKVVESAPARAKAETI